jgi:hypothetical protein
MKVVDPCVIELNFGTIEELDTQVTMFALNMASGRIDQYLLVSSATGELIFEPEEIEYFSTNVPFRFFFRTEPLEPNLVLTIGEDTYECVEITFGVIS